MENPPDGLVERLEALGKEAERAMLKQPKAVWSDRTYLAPRDYPVMLQAAARIRELEGELAAHDRAMANERRRWREHPMMARLNNVRQSIAGLRPGDAESLSCAQAEFLDVEARAQTAEAALTEALKERDEADRLLVSMMSDRGMPTGHGDTLSDLIAEAFACFDESSAASLARAERMEGALRRIVSRRNRVGLPDGFDQTMFDRAERVLAVRQPSSALSLPPSPQDLGSACCDQERTGTPAPPSSTAVSDGEE